jgi:hypothetical protein
MEQATTKTTDDERTDHRADRPARRAPADDRAAALPAAVGVLPKPNALRRPSCGGEGSLNDRPYRQAQEWGLPPRITGSHSGCEIDAGATPIDQVTRKEVVIENDIGWRVETMIDYLFGKPIVIDSAAPDPDRRAQISELLASSSRTTAASCSSSSSRCSAACTASWTSS